MTALHNKARAAALKRLAEKELAKYAAWYRRSLAICHTSEQHDESQSSHHDDYGPRR